MSDARHRWRFFRAGGVDQVRLETGAALLALDTLDPKLWVALACPTTSIEFDARFLQLLDTDKDGRIRVGDVTTTVKWLRTLLKDPEDLVAGRTELALSALRDDSPEGTELKEAARHALTTLGKADAASITLADARAALDKFHQQPLNGDGVVVPDALDDAGLRQLTAEMLRCFPGEPDRSGVRGVGKATATAFFTEAEAHVAWQKALDADPALRPLGEGTAAGHALFSALEAKVEDYFTRCRFAAFDARAVAALNRDEKDIAVLAPGALSADAQELAGFPLAHVAPNRPLPLEEGVNPAWAERVAAFAKQVVEPLLGGKRRELSLEEWRQVRAALTPYGAWFAKRCGQSVEPLGRARLEQVLADGSRARLDAVLDAEKALEKREKALTQVERLLYCVRDLAAFCNNFVNFRDFYGRKKATFQAGTLYLDQRSCDLCIQVESAAAHATMSPLARAYLVYCDCVRLSTGEKKTIVAAVTAGDSDNLMVGRNGLFYDRKGQEWDATITRIVDNPISVRQAFWSPYKKLVRFIEDLVTQRAAKRDTAAQSNLTGAVTTLAEATPPSPGEPGAVTPGGTTAVLPAAAPAPGAAAAAPAKKPLIDVGVVAALGVAVGGLTAAFGAILQAFFGLGLWMPLGFVALLLAVSGPSMLLAWLKLRQRNVGPLLDANGWAINTRARINVAFGGALTRTAALPPGVARDMRDPFPEKKPKWPLYLALLAAVALAVFWARGRFDPWLPEAMKAQVIFGWDVEIPPPAAR